MRIAFTTGGESPQAPLDSRFGRAPKFMIFDSEKNSFEVVNNEVNLNAAQGAGIQSAQNIARKNVQCVITGHCGPKAFRVLTESGIAVYQAQDITIEGALREFHQGSLTQVKAADVEGHWA